LFKVLLEGVVRVRATTGRGERVWRRVPRAIALAAVGAVLAVAATSGITAASADDYPTYQEVLDAREDVSAAKALKKRIQSRIDGLQAEVSRTAAIAEKAGETAQEADQDYQEQALEYQELSTQASDASASADAASRQAAELISRMYRDGDGDLTLTLLANAAEAGDLLDSYGMASKLTEQAQTLYADAVQKSNTAQKLSDQADVAAGILEQYKKKADAALAVASQAADAASGALAEQEVRVAELQAQLAVLESTVSTTEKEYQKGVEERRRIAEAARRTAIGGTGAQDPGEIVNGWTNPAFGRITSSFGWRVNPLGSGRVYHLGTDIGAGCGAAEFAAHAGTVEYAGWNGIYGNYIRINVGGGITIEYGHIVAGGILVGQGDHVEPGDLIARVGSTGGSTGCHLHYGVRIDGLVTDPVAFMSARGVSLGS
jgi:murein DD-endopeptidase MepM/ murein hydrolase activator NlpD